MRSDWEIRFEICDRLVMSPDIDPEKVYVSVRDGTVRLSGLVVSRHAHDVAVRIALSVHGVRDIVDQLSDVTGQ